MCGLCLHLLSNRLDLMYLGYKYEDQKKIKIQVNKVTQLHKKHKFNQKKKQKKTKHFTEIENIKFTRMRKT